MSPADQVKSSPPPSRSKAGLPGLLLAVALLIAQLVNFALVERDSLAQQRTLGRPGREGAEVDASELALVAYRTLAELAPRIPTDARVLLVADSDTPVPYDFQLLPRPLAVLFRVDEKLSTRLARFDPFLGEIAVEWHAEIRQRDQWLTPEALRRHLAQADWLITVCTSKLPLELPADGPRRELVASAGPISLFRLVAAP